VRLRDADDRNRCTNWRAESLKDVKSFVGFAATI
jgi:hypothetical protein